MHTGHPKHPLKETLKADVPAYHFVVIIFSKHSPGLADKLQTQHSRWALSLSLSLFLHFFLGIPFFSFRSVCCHTLSAVAGWRGGGEPEEVERGKQDGTAAWRLWLWTCASWGPVRTHTDMPRHKYTHTHRVLRVFLFVPGASLLLQSQTSTWLFITGDTPQLVKVNTWEGKRESPAFGLA